MIRVLASIIIIIINVNPAKTMCLLGALNVNFSSSGAGDRKVDFLFGYCRFLVYSEDLTK
jgi:hypothetical protein